MDQSLLDYFEQRCRWYNEQHSVIACSVEPGWTWPLAFSTLEFMNAMAATTSGPIITVFYPVDDAIRLPDALAIPNIKRWIECEQPPDDLRIFIKLDPFAEGLLSVVARSPRLRRIIHERYRFVDDWEEALECINDYHYGSLPQAQ
jgi:hypothetical protein